MVTEGMSPYSPEHEQEQPPELPTKPSKLPKVIGVLHVCIGSLTLISGAVALIQGVDLSDSLQKSFGSIAEAKINLSADAVTKLEVLDVPSKLSGVMDFLASLLMLVAGIGLVKGMKWGRHLSNGYVTIALLSKSLSCYLIMILAKPFFDVLIAENSQLEVIGAAAIQWVIVVGIIVGSIYALVSAVVVNLKGVTKTLK